MDTLLEVIKNSRTLKNEDIYSPGEVMRILNSDNQEIQRLCKEVNIFPKKDNQTGKIFFFKNDVELLKKIKDLHNKSQKVAIEKQVANNSLKENIRQCLKDKIYTEHTEKVRDVEPVEHIIKKEVRPQIQQEVKPEPRRLAAPAVEQSKPVSATNPIAVKKPEILKLTESLNTAVSTVNDAISTVQDNVIEKLSCYMDEKLDGLDEVIVDLIKCKVENERLKIKIEQLTKENFALTNKLSSFTPIALGLYLKKD